jgi:hypothetical protein
VRLQISARKKGQHVNVGTRRVCVAHVSKYLTLLALRKRMVKNQEKGLGPTEIIGLHKGKGIKKC